MSSSRHFDPAVTPSDDNRLTGRVRRYAQVSRRVGGLAARLAASGMGKACGKRQGLRQAASNFSGNGNAKPKLAAYRAIPCTGIP